MMQVLDLLGYVKKNPLVAGSWFRHFRCRLKDCFSTEAERSLTIGIHICIILASAFLASCGDAETQKDATFTYNEPQGLTTLDPAMAGISGPIHIGGHIFETLVKLDSNGGIIPGLAKSWTVDETGLNWTFSLLTDISFHKDSCFGAPSFTRKFKADDVKFSFERICDARTKTTGFWIFRDRVLGADEFHEATKNGLADRNIKGIKVINDSTVALTLHKPFAPLLSLLTMPYCRIIPKEAIQMYGESFGDHPIGTGPFAFHKWEQDRFIELKRNPLYHEFDESGKQLPYLDTVIVQFIKDTKTEFLEYDNGNLDMILSIDPIFLPRVLENDKLTSSYASHNLYREEAQDIVFCGIMLDEHANAETSRIPLWKSQKIRQALNYAIDRKALCKYVLKGKGIPAEHGPLSPSMPGFSNEVKGYAYDPVKAKTLLMEAGYPGGKGLPEILLQSGNNATTVQVIEALQQQWLKFGIKVALRQVNFPEHSAMMHSGKLGFWRGNWIADYPDPENVLALFYSKMASPKGLNDTRFSHRGVDSLYELALWPGLSTEQRFKAYNEMERIIIDQAPWVFLYYTINYRLAQTSVIGLRPGVFGTISLERVRFQNR
jgi:peptide/nickel transport system substrate-binding protein